MRLLRALVTTMTSHLLELRRHAFVLWRPGVTQPAPRLIIGRFDAGNPPSLSGEQAFALASLPTHPDVWTVTPADCGLLDGQVYHYWFEVTDVSAYRDGRRIRCTDPLAHTVDWRLLAPRLSAPYDADDQDPAAVIKFEHGELLACDPDGRTFAPLPRLSVGSAPNNQLVIYELPTAWTRINVHGDPQIGVGTFKDVLALIAADASAANFDGVPALEVGRSHLERLGVNALELLPITDSFVEREWGYAPSNYFAPDFDLGFPDGNESPTATADLVELIQACHQRGMRFIIDVVMAFATRAPLENVNFADFHIDPQLTAADADSQQSGGQGMRDAFGGRLWRYSKLVHGYDPSDGQRRDIHAARQFMFAYLARWQLDFAIDGIRMDSVNNVANWDFVHEFKDQARARWVEQGGSEDRFLVVGEELSVPQALLTTQRLDGLWNEQFKRMVRYAVQGLNDEREPSFEWTIRKLIDCRLLGFRDGAQAVNYVGSHDVEGFRNERLFNFLLNNGIALTEQRIKLAFACLLTAVGIPMIFAGDEFADQHDLSVKHPPKQRDAVNYGRVDEPFRKRIFEYVARLVKFRTTYAALAVNDTDFIHVDFNDGKRVVCWRRGFEGGNEQAVVVANFSEFRTDSVPGASEYRVPNWPATPPGKRWREITQARDVPAEWVAREPIFPWEAKVYALV